jgi:hypothetical protein
MSTMKEYLLRSHEADLNRQVRQAHHRRSAGIARATGRATRNNPQRRYPQ